VFLTGTGGLLDERGRVIDSINLSTEYEALIEADWVHSGMLLKLQQIHDLLSALPPSSSVSITSPDQLARELFTHRGSGTLVRRGERILQFESWDQVDRPRLATLVESSFGRRLTPDYFQQTELWRLYVSEHYRAAIVLTLEDGVPHMDKFAVSEQAQGEGLGRAIWQVMQQDVKTLFWRSRRSNAINGFYADESDGCIKGRPWNIYWYGLDSMAGIEQAVTHCRERPATLIEREEGIGESHEASA